MKEWMTPEEAGQFLREQKEGVLAFAGGKFPYAVPLNYVYHNEKLYIHCAMQGEKLEQLKQNPNVCFTAFTTGGFSYNAEAQYACGINTMYASVIVRGAARIVENDDLKKEALYALLQSVAPQMAAKPLSESSFAKTTVVEITPVSVTGKIGS